MNRHALLADLIRKTAEVVKQEGEQGMESFFMPAGLEASLPMPKPVRQSAPSPRIDSLDALYEKYHRCTACQLGYKRKHFVFGSGNEQADVMFVGEAPGSQEDEQGQPFVGPAGQLLTRILNAIDFTRTRCTSPTS